MEKDKIEVAQADVIDAAVRYINLRKDIDSPHASVEGNQLRAAVEYLLEVTDGNY